MEARQSKAIARIDLDNKTLDAHNIKPAAKGNQAIFNAGKSFLMAMEGKAIPKGLLLNIVDAVSKQDISSISGLSASSSGLDIHNALMQAIAIMEKVLADTGATAMLVGAEKSMRVLNERKYLALIENDVAAKLKELDVTDPKVCADVTTVMKDRAKAKLANAKSMKEMSDHISVATPKEFIDNLARTLGGVEGGGIAP